MRQIADRRSDASHPPQAPEDRLAIIEALRGLGGAGACGDPVALLSRNHHPYEPYDTVRVPRPGRMLGRAYWCQDTGPANPPDSEVVYALPGVAADQGFLVRGRIWLRTDRAQPPAAIGKLQVPVSCRRAGALSGQIEQFNDHRAGNPSRSQCRTRSAYGSTTDWAASACRPTTTSG